MSNYFLNLPSGFSAKELETLCDSSFVQKIKNRPPLRLGEVEVKYLRKPFEICFSSGVGWHTDKHLIEYKNNRFDYHLILQNPGLLVQVKSLMNSEPQPVGNIVGFDLSKSHRLTKGNDYAGRANYIAVTFASSDVMVVKDVINKFCELF
jgi:hypothetical protein